MFDYMNSMERFHETSFPSKDKFFSKLSDKHISRKQYQHVWDKFQCKTQEDYHSIYLKGDVLLLADFFEKFSNTSLHKYRLDPVHYYTGPGLAWDAAIRVSKVKLELIKDIDIYNFIENSIRGGISMISNRYARSNNIYNMCFESDSEKPKSYISYLDANNLYGGAMSQPLPTGGFNFLDEDEKPKFPVADMNTVLSSLADDDDIGYIMGVDLEYPKALHTSIVIRVIWLGNY